jgi:hypothetical protein
MHNRHIPQQRGGVMSRSHSITTFLLWSKGGMQLVTVSSESLELLTWDLKSLHRGPSVPYLKNLNLRPRLTVVILWLVVAIMLMETGKMEMGKKTRRYTMYHFDWNPLMFVLLG